MRAMHFFKIFLCIQLSLTVTVKAQVFQMNNGTVDFRSEAPLEIIKASSSELKGLIDFTQGTFAFSIPIISFKGFNSALQREHFNENYMETERYPRATFAGKLIEQVDITRDGEYAIRAKGKLTIHGVEQERIIPSTVIVKEERSVFNPHFPFCWLITTSIYRKLCSIRLPKRSLSRSKQMVKRDEEPVAFITLPFCFLHFIYANTPFYKACASRRL